MTLESSSSSSSTAPNLASMDITTTEGPRLIRPIPRRPFKLDLAPPPSEETSCPGTPTITANDLSFLDSRRGSTPGFRGGSSTLNREDSLLNLTAPALSSIYSPIQYVDDPPLEHASSSETGFETPVRGRIPSMDRVLPSARRTLSTETTSEASSPTSSLINTLSSSLVFRGLLLFVLGIGYGVLVTQLPSKRNLSAFGVENLAVAGLRWEFLTFWGLAGIALGSLLPWVDGMWEGTRPKQGDRKAAIPEADWALVVRGVGCFVGIVFAIRRLPWASTSQVSMTLALANPFMWYVIDRSRAGLLLSAALGGVGSAVLLGVNPGIMPSPIGPRWAAVPFFPANITAAGFDFEEVLEALVGEPTQGLVETGMWILSILFCSSICFGNIGRRLALSSSAATRGRWGGLR